MMSRFTKLSPTVARQVSLALLVVSTAAWLMAVGLPFAGMFVNTSLALTGWVTGLIIVAEGTFLLAIALGGRVWISPIKQFISTHKNQLLTYLYGVGFLVGTIGPLTQFVPFLLEYGFDVPEFFRQLWANRVSAFFGWDVLVSVPVLLVLITAEGQRLSVAQKTACYLFGVLVGCSSGLPLFLYFRQRRAGIDPER